MAIKNKDYLDSLLSDLRECEDELSSGDFYNGFNEIEEGIIEARVRRIQKEIRDNFPDIDPKVYRFSPGN
jgi:hypothetical protein